MKYRLPQVILTETFEQFRRCGGGRRECQALWVSAWHDPTNISAIVHPRHMASAADVQVDPAWIGEFWNELVAEKIGIRMQVHTHPGAAYHSATDDAFPVIHQAGFLSLVVPEFGLRTIGFGGAYLAELMPSGNWQQVPIRERIELV